MRSFNVELRFPNPNADFVITVAAKSKRNALWVAAERRRSLGFSDAQIGEITRA